MLVEDGLSLCSFGLALLYLHYSGGAPLALLSKHLAGTDESEGAFPAEEARPVRLFYVAL